MSTKKNEHKALITGASGGIGYELAKLFAQDGIDLVLVARRKDVLQKIKAEFEESYKIKVAIFDMDLSVSGSAAELFKTCKSHSHRIDYLINNAGYGNYNKVIDSEAADYENMLNLNVTTLTELSCFFAKEMVKNKFGRILNVGSVAAFQPVPMMAVYGASKAYVMSFTEALHSELEGTGVTATVLSPGVTETGFIERADMSNSALANGSKMSAEDVAKSGYKAMNQGGLNKVPGFLNKMLAVSTGLMPSRRLLLAISTMVMREKAGKN